MSNLSFTSLVKNADNEKLIVLYDNYKKEIDYYEKKLCTSLENDKDDRYINVTLNEFRYLFTLENLKCIISEIKTRGIRV